MLASSNSGGSPGSGLSGRAAFSSDGSQVAFASTAANLVTGDSNNAADIFLKTLATGEVRLVSSSVTSPANNNSGSPAFLADNSVAFLSNATNLIPNDTNNATDLLRASLPPGAQTARLSIAALLADRAEGQAGGTPFSFTVTRTGELSGSHSVGWSVAGSGTHPATAADFANGILPSGTVSFAAGETSKTITVTVAGDAIVEADEGFTVTLASPGNGAVLGTASAGAIIRNDDPQLLETVAGTSGADMLVHRPGSHIYDGGAGLDVLDMGVAGRFGLVVALLPDGSTAITSGSGTDVLRSVEELRFTDGRLVFDASDPAAQVVRLYQAALGRGADQLGLNFWIDQIHHGRPLSALAEGFINSDEFVHRYGAGLNTADFVEALYNNALGRASDAAGKAHWVRLLDTQVLTRAEALAGFSESAENRLQTAHLVQQGIWDLSENAAFVARLYDTTLGRLPDVAGLHGWRQQLDHGMLSYAQMADGFTESAEFAARYGSGTSTMDFVELLYNNALHRSSDPLGKDHWSALIDGHAMTRAEAVLGFSESAEHIALTAPRIMSDDPGQFGINFA
ncbi:DUF4214 domain-containing protein [Teichococcus vastitatis]|uniref:DUF4214 domain-containing protein n=1 Tax=Teichococcus vastitatis TaxID=2307076 RepID=A0ABS9WA36_9PROT|nr:DUF4214 domain-containing protein [Pseudoroseomonas vastitatis]MCI0756168.1 DUF4214 domain-containing protein [Pseudoroseomonas vastitatis]